MNEKDELVKFTVLIPGAIGSRLKTMSEELGLLPSELAGLWLTLETIRREHIDERSDSRADDSRTNGDVPAKDDD